MAEGRYRITIRKGTKIFERRCFNDYDTAMDWMDFLEDKIDRFYAIGASIEFEDLNPFQKK